MTLDELDWVEWVNGDAFGDATLRLAIVGTKHAVWQYVDGSYTFIVGGGPIHMRVDALTVQCLLHEHFPSGGDNAA
jgi:hypothetical protein